VLRSNSKANSALVENLWVGESHFLARAFGKFFFLVHFVSCFQIGSLVGFARSFQFSFLPLVKVRVDFRFRLFGESFGQVSLAQVFSSAMFTFGYVRFLKLGSFLRSIV